VDTLFQQIRSTCKLVAQSATHVRIQEDRLAEYARSLPLERALRPEHEPMSHYLGHGDDTVAFFVTLDTINFMSGYNPHLRKRPGMSGYFTTAAALNDHFQRHGPVSARQLIALDTERCASIFGQDLENPPVRELMNLFAAALNELGRFLTQRFDGRFVDLVDAAGSSA